MAKAGATTTPTAGQPPGSARPTSHTWKTSRPAVATSTAATGPTHPCCSVHPYAISRSSVTAMSFQPTKNSIFLFDTQNNIHFLADSGVSLSILLHASTEPPTGSHLAIAARFHRAAHRPASGNCCTLPQSRPQAPTWQLLHASTEPPTGPHLAIAARFH
jgi:hypothetical protein